MTDFISTRDASVTYDGATAVACGIAKDGGLFVPPTIPVFDIKELCDMDYEKRADYILRKFFDFDIKGVASHAYGESDDPVPTVKIDDNAFVLELWHGKAFTSKDIAYSVHSQLLQRAKSALNITEQTLIPVATNGDMGKAACEAFKDADGMRVCVFYPQNGIDSLHKKELLSQAGNNICVVGVNADFDEVQSAVKSALCDESLSAALKQSDIALSSANSVNIGIIVPQIVYYFSAYCDLVNSGEIKLGDEIDFVMPSGNFGGTLVGYYAVKMGLPVNRLVCASCGHSALADFINSGVYDITEKNEFTAPVLGNLERLIFEISGRNEKLTAQRMDELKSSGRFSVSEDEINKVRKVFAGDCVDYDDVDDMIYDLFDVYGYLAGRNTAIAFEIAQLREFVRPTVIISAAHPFRSAYAVMTALGERVNGYDEKLLRRLEDLSAMDAPTELLNAFTAKQLHDAVISPREITDFIKERYCNN